MPTQGTRAGAVAALTLLAASAHAAGGGVAVHVVRADLKPLIRAAADSPVQFAVPVPHAASAASSGSWSVAGGEATWRYAVRVPTAVSLSFHAAQSFLPESAVLVVRGAKTTTSYRARDLHRGELWSRIHPGEALEFRLTVATTERSQVAFKIISLQAGYRSLGPGVLDHPYYRQLKAQATAASNNTACVTNYACQITANNTPPGAATVGLLIGNLWECTGSLINDVPRDNTPYILTARHCETGKLSGGNPGVAASVTVYWDAVASCGALLGSFYDPGIANQTGATTRVEQQDMWLIELDDSPVVADAQFVGFDASGGAVQGGYSIHHAKGYDKQFTAWFAQAAVVQENNVLGSGYLSNYLETVNQIGNVAPGASGGGLFDQNDHLVGALSVGPTPNDPSGYGACPTNPLQAPNGTNGVADFTSLSAVWNSTADTTSSTGSTTLQSVLDPSSTGTLVVQSMASAPISFTASPAILDAGQTSQLSWSAPNASQCSAGGGVPGDGWSGTVLSASGSQSVSESAGLNATYTLKCTLTTGGSVGAKVQIVWNGSVPFVQVSLPRSIVWTTRPVEVTWTSNVSPCAISGGGLSQTGLASSGAMTTTQSTPGDVTYQVSCGAGPTAASSTQTESYITPNVLLVANGTDRLLGETFQLGWIEYGDICTPSGGAPSDGWGSNSFVFPQIFSPNVTAAGTYTYTLTCSAGPLSVQSDVTVTFENNAPYVSASLSPATTTYSDSPADYLTVDWTSNLTFCQVNSMPSLGLPVGQVILFSDFDTVDGPLTFAPSGSGTFTVSVNCVSSRPNGPSVSSTPMTFTVQPPPPPTTQISITPATVAPGENFTIAWQSTNASSCTPTGGTQIPGSVWLLPMPPTGSLTLSLNGPGQFTLGMVCSSIDPNTATTASAQAMLSIETLSATLTASQSQVTNGSSFTLMWTSTAATGCAAGGGGANGTPWTGSLGPSGSVTQTATTNGSFTYSVTCSAGNVSTVQDITVTVTAPHGGGGGGSISVLEVALLAALRFLQRHRRRLGQEEGAAGEL